MIRGIQSAAVGMIAQMDGQDQIANNLANANTSGYKRDVPSFSAILSGLAGAAPMSQIASTPCVDMSQGAIKETGDKFNLALDGDGFFAVQTSTGTAYTRDGAFTLSKDGYLTTGSGDRVLGNAGPIKLANGDFQVGEDGKVTQNGSVVDTLRIVSLGSPSQAQRVGGNLWSAAGIPAPATGVRVHQGCLEASNVNTVGEMVSMIAGLRTYEASQKAVQAQDETLEKLVNDVGRVG